MSYIETMTAKRLECPVFHPTLEEFDGSEGGFYSYVLKIEQTLLAEGNNVGMCKIIPPQGWNYKKIDINELSKHLIIRNPIRQGITGGAGVFNMNLCELKDMTLNDFIAIANKNECINTYEEREKLFWKTLGLNVGWEDAVYGADMVGSLFDKEQKTSWNLDQIDSILRLLNVNIPGVTNSMLYFGMWRAAFAYHCEDMDLFSVNYLHHGCPKSWYCLGM